MKKQEVFESLDAPIYVHIKNRNGMFKVVAIGWKHFVIEVKNENNKRYKVDYARFLKLSNNKHNKDMANEKVSYFEESNSIGKFVKGKLPKLHVK